MGHSGATSLPLIGKSFMYIEVSSRKNGNEVVVSFELIVIIQISYNSFYYNSCSILIIDSFKSMDRFRFQLLADYTWSTHYNISEKDRYGISPTQWTKKFKFYCGKLWYQNNLRSNRHTTCRYVL